MQFVQAARKCSKCSGPILPAGDPANMRTAAAAAAPPEDTARGHEIRAEAGDLRPPGCRDPIAAARPEACRHDPIAATAAEMLPNLPEHLPERSNRSGPGEISLFGADQKSDTRRQI